MEGEILVQLSSLGEAKFEEVGEPTLGESSSCPCLFIWAPLFASAEGADIAIVGEEFGMDEDVSKSEEEDIDKGGT
jgi:hypothetical protein